jgi:hypothetical protein
MPREAMSTALSRRNGKDANSMDAIAQAINQIPQT